METYGAAIVKTRLIIATMSVVLLSGCGTGAYLSLMQQSADRIKSSNGTLSNGSSEAGGTTPAASRRNNGGNDGANLRIPDGGMQSGLGQVVEAGNRTVILSNCRNIVNAAIGYESTRRALPPTAIVGSDGTPLLSWRVALLQEMAPQLYRKFNIKEPWDSEQNIALLDQMPPAYDMGYRLEVGDTVVLGIVGSETVFEGGDKKVRLASVQDGTRSTGMFVVATHAAAVPWTKPQELNYSDDLGSIVPKMAEFWPNKSVYLKKYGE